MQTNLHLERETPPTIAYEAPKEPVNQQMPEIKESEIKSVINSNSENDFVTEDDFFKEFSEQPRFSADTVMDENGMPHVDSSLNQLSEEKPPMPDSEALENAEILMDMRETVQAYGLSWYVDGNFKNSESYLYESEPKKRLIRAWSRVIGHYRIKVSPWMDVMLAEAIGTGPLINVAVKARKQRKIIEEQAARISELERQSGDRQPRQNASRSDTKTQWQVDENGYFTYTTGNVYIKKPDRKEKPDLTPENYQLLCRYNGKDVIDRVFKIQN